MNKQSRCRGMTLIEILVAMGIFAILSAGLFGIVLQSRRSAESAVVENTAATAAQGYVEQIKAIQYNTLIDCLTDPTNKPIPTIIDTDTPDPIYINQRNYKQLVINIDSTNTVTQHMDFWVTPTITNLQPITGRKALEVKLDFEWQSPDHSSSNLRSSSIRFICSAVQN